MEYRKCFASIFVILIISAVVNCRPQGPEFGDGDGDLEEPGWWKRQFERIGKAAGKVGNAFGGTATRLTNAIDKVCGVIKKILPIVGAICTVGQFQFCVLENGVAGATSPEIIAGGQLQVAGK